MGVGCNGLGERELGLSYAQYLHTQKRHKLKNLRQIGGKFQLHKLISKGISVVNDSLFILHAVAYYMSPLRQRVSMI